MLPAAGEIASAATSVPDPVLRNAAWSWSAISSNLLAASGLSVGGLSISPEFDWVSADAVTTNGAGRARFHVRFSHPFPGAGYITATATDPANNTSEFSQCVAVTSLPTLAVARASSNQVSLAWTNTATGFVLKQTGNLSQPVQWTTVTNNPVNMNGQFVVTQNMTATNRFYLLSFE
jgi:hypothetical protein